MKRCPCSHDAREQDILSKKRVSREKSMKRLLSLVLAMLLLVMQFANTGFAQTTEAIPEPEYSARGGEALSLESFLRDDSTSPVYTEDMTWAQGAKLICRLLGFLQDDVADTDIAAYEEVSSSLSVKDDSLYLAILAEHGYLPEISGIHPESAMPQAAFQRLLDHAFPAAVHSQEDVQALPLNGDTENIAVSGDEIHLSAMKANRLALGTAGRVTLSGIRASALSVLDTDKVYLKGSKIERTVIDRLRATETLLHIDRETQLSEIYVAGAGDLTIEGNGALGIIRVLGNTGTITVRATGSVLNATDAEVAVVGPDGQRHNLAPGGSVDLSLKSYLVHFITDGTPVPSQTIAPGGMLDADAIYTEKEGYLFTAWYEDENYTIPHGFMSPVEGEMTLYARFVDETEALTVRFETFGGTSLEPLVFAAGENLLCKPLSQLYTSKEGYSFSGWCIDEACEQAFSYTDAITQDMTLYALFISLEQVKEEKETAAAQLEDLDWQGEIPLTVSEDIGLKDLQALVTLEAGSGGEEPVLSFRETERGWAIYGAYYESGGETGFEPGSTFSITLAEGIRFEGYSESVETLSVSIFREQVENVEFVDGLVYVDWEQVLEYQPVTDYEGPEEEGPATPGSLLLQGMETFAPGEIIVFYDGEINDDEKPIAAWEQGSFDGYVLFAEVMTAVDIGTDTLLTFQYADPAQYLSVLEVHTSRDVSLEEIIDDDRIACIIQDIQAQVYSNDELNAQMLVSVMSDPATQQKLDELYGVGVYQLASVSFGMEKGTPGVNLTIDKNTVSVSITVGASVNLVNDEFEPILGVQVSLTFEEEVSVYTTINGGWVWIDASVDIISRSSIGLEISAFTDTGEELGNLASAKESLERIISPEGFGDLENQEDYLTPVTELMDTMQALVNTGLPYVDIFETELMKLQVSFKGIVIFTVQLDLVGQVGLLATFGVEIVVTQGERVGFDYNFLKFSGRSYSEKLESSVNSNVYLIGKVGARLGLKLTFSVSLCSIAEAKISGVVFAYAELTGMYFYTASLLSGEATSVGGLHFEVGIDAEITLGLSVKVIFFTIRKEWTVWSERWPLYAMDWSSQLVVMDTERLDRMWQDAIADADYKSAFGFFGIPMRSYEMTTGRCVTNELLWDSIQQGGASLTLEIANLIVDGEPIAPEDPKSALFRVGDGKNGTKAGYVYLDEEIAGEYECEKAELDIILTYENASTAALVKKQVRTFHLERSCTIATTTVNMQFKLMDWCARSWGLEAADWDGALLHEVQMRTSHAVGGAFEVSKAASIDLMGIVESAGTTYPALAGLEASWAGRTANGMEDTSVLFSVPRTSFLCYLLPNSNTVRYEVFPGTRQYTLTWYIQVFRFPGYSGEIEYIAKLLNANGENEYAFALDGGAAQSLPFAADTSQSDTWNLRTSRAGLNGRSHPLLLSIDQGEGVDTGLHVNGLEPEETVLLEVNPGESRLDITVGEGINAYTIVSPEIVSGALVQPGTEIVLSAEPVTGHRLKDPVSTPEGLPMLVADTQVMFRMPFHDVELLLEGVEARKISYHYNHGDLGLYLNAYVGEGEILEEPEPPVIEGMTFRGWYDTPEGTGEPFAFGKTPDNDIQLYASWTCDVTIDFNGAAGQAAYLDADGSQVLLFERDTTLYLQYTFSTLRPGEGMPEILVPNHDGYAFTGWYLSRDCTGTPVDLSGYRLEEGITLYAGWVEVFSVVFMLNYPVSAEASAAEEEATGREPGVYFTTFAYAGQPMQELPNEEPTREMYTFTGWYTQENCEPIAAFDPTVDLPLGDLVLYAGWDINTFHIDYDLGGGTNHPDNPTAYTMSEAVTLREPARAGYDFAGWVEDAQSNTPPIPQVIIPAGSSGDRAYTARWEATVYEIAYNNLKNGDNTANATQYTIESPDITVEPPTREHFTFTGWTGLAPSDIAIGANGEAVADTGNLEPAMQVKIPAGSTGDRMYTAGWSTGKAEYQILEAAGDAIMKTYQYSMDDDHDADHLDEAVYDDAWGAIEADGVCGPYAQFLELVLVRNDAAASEDSEKYIYGYSAALTFTGEDGIATSLEPNPSLPVFLRKRMPRVKESPTASALKYGRPLSDSVLSGGVMVNGPEGKEMEVKGNFYWAIRADVPISTENGKAVHEVGFMPEDFNTYQATSILVAVETQIGVRVKITAEDKIYDGTQSAVGHYTLHNADQGGKLLEEAGLSLSGATYTFASANPGTHTVTCEGYSLSGARDIVARYALIEEVPTTTATISQAELTVVKPPKAITVPYDTPLADIPLVGGEVKFGSVPVRGTWAWDSEAAKKQAETPMTVADSPHACPAVFTPDDTSSFLPVTAAVALTFTKRIVEIAVPVDLTYNREVQQFDTQALQDLREKGYITFSEGIDVGSIVYEAKEWATYPVDIYLKDLENCIFAEPYTGEEKIRIYFNLNRAQGEQVEDLEKKRDIAYGERVQAYYQDDRDRNVEEGELTLNDMLQVAGGGALAKTPWVEYKIQTSEGLKTINNVELEGTYQLLYTMPAEQPFSAAKGFYLIARFIPAEDRGFSDVLSKPIRIEVEPVSPVVNLPEEEEALQALRATPGFENFNGFSAKGAIRRVKGSSNPLRSATLTVTPNELPRSPVTGEEVAGTWQWDEPDTLVTDGIDLQTARYGLSFVPTDKDNYLTVALADGAILETREPLIRFDILEFDRTIGQPAYPLPLVPEACSFPQTWDQKNGTKVTLAYRPYLQVGEKVYSYHFRSCNIFGEYINQGQRTDKFIDIAYINRTGLFLDADSRIIDVKKVEDEENNLTTLTFTLENNWTPVSDLFLWVCFDIREPEDGTAPSWTLVED